MDNGLIVHCGRVLLARCLLGLESAGITHCALGEGDASFADPARPPAPQPGQSSLKSERCRKRFYKRSFLEPHPEGEIAAGGQSWRETASETSTVGVFFRFETHEANGLAIREYGFFGGAVAYLPEVAGDYAAGGLYDPQANPAGQVLQAGRLFELKHIPDFYKLEDTQLELVGLFHF